MKDVEKLKCDESKNKMAKIFSFVVPLLTGLTAALANEDAGDHVDFPQWTYWVEIIEHNAMIIVAIAAIIYLAILYKKYHEKRRTIKIMIFGIALFAFSQIL